MKIKIRSTAGTAVVEVAETMSVLDMTRQVLADHFPGGSIASYKYGFPSKSIDSHSEISLKDAGVRPNDQLLASSEDGSDSHTVKAQTTSSTPAKAPPPDMAYVHIPEQSTNLILRNVPDDNSCLFNAVSLALTGSIDWKALNLRGIVADTIRRSPELYTEAILGRSLEDYCLWIQKSESSGGAIELGILSKHLNVRIMAYDIDLGSPITFQDEVSPPTLFIALVYSGIHYDTLVVNSILSTNRAGDLGKWDDDIGITAAADKLVKLLQSKNYATNTTKFRIRCLECYEVLVGEMGASRHANSTGHFRFGEV